MKFFTLLMLLVSTISYAQIPGITPKKQWDLNGYIKYMSSTKLSDKNENGFDQLLQLRFNYEYRFSPQFRFNTSMRNRLLAGDNVKIPAYATLINNDPGYINLSFNSLDSNDLIANTHFERLYFDWSHQDWQVRLGRSRINWAMSTLWNPNDVFNSGSIYDFDYDEHAGSDSILLKKKLGFASSIELVYNPNQDSDLTGLAGRYLFNQSSWDIQLLAGKSQLDYIIGGGLAGDLQGAGLRAEITWFEPTQQSWNNGTELRSLQSSLVATVEMDHSWISQRNWMIRASVLYISHAQTQESTVKHLNLALTARTLSFTKHTFYTDISFDINALSRLTLSSSYYDDGSYFVGINHRYSLANNYQLLAVLQRFDGIPDSLFASTANLFAFVQLKWSF